MRDNTGFFKTHYDQQSGWMINNYSIKTLRGSKVKINENNYNITEGLQKVITNQSYETAKSLNDTENLVFILSYRKQVIIIANLQKDACLVVINILVMNWLMM